MELRLPHPVIPEFMPQHAETIVAVVKKLKDIELTYTVDSLAAVDEILGEFHEDPGSSAKIPETAFMFGAYIGEVMVRQAGGKWTASSDSTVGTWPVVSLEDDWTVDPIGKAFKRIDLGNDEDLSYFYRVMVGR